MKKKTGLVMMLIGVLIIIYPLIAKLTSEKEQAYLLEQVGDSMTVEESFATYGILNDTFSRQDDLLANQDLVEQSEIEEALNTSLDAIIPQEGMIEEVQKEITYNKDRLAGPPELLKSGDVLLMGRIFIPSISINMPLVEGTGDNEIAVSTGHLLETAYPGHIGNSVIAGHRGYDFGRLFNRLDELKKDDFIHVQTSQGDFTYRVYQTKIVEPEDTSVTNQTRDFKVLTLITCTPIYTSEKRLIIHAAIVE